MRRLIILALPILLGICGAQANYLKKRTNHIWILKDKNAYELTDYDVANCIPNLDTYCTYWTTTDFTFHAMPDTVFQVFLNAGYFTGHDYNKIYIE